MPSTIRLVLRLKSQSVDASAVTARRMRGKRFSLELAGQDAVILQDALDDYARDGGAGTKRWQVRLGSLQRRLHELTGEEMPPTFGRDGARPERAARMHVVGDPIDPMGGAR